MWGLNQDGNAIPTIGDIASAIASTGVVLDPTGLDGVVVETGLNARQALAIQSSALAGVLSGAATTTVTIPGAASTTALYAQIPFVLNQVVNDAGTGISFGAATYDPNGLRTSSTDITIPSTGLWSIKFMSVIYTAAPGFITMEINRDQFIGGSRAVVRRNEQIKEGISITVEVSALLRLNVSQILTVKAYCGNLGSTMLFASDDTTTLSDSNLLTFIKISD